ncbi:hypothetical protein BU25DRAFT_485324 [Macroventuria anomochaeta]|uniref:Uncharacterized protein n=1 Tax=Macroventuria anomochaeta TaxID=301207 RepID=A0ACB6S780_9PLEO|nr:uncharacterized protein BU25DRAFT_485324 [Macroventuria anomochaeta]KAF2630141.1 hypothetical protein BU25DRAFT_485324 [Macroventuria anomochaeta]
MYSKGIISAFAASLALSSPYAKYGRLNPTYTKEQLNEIKLTYTEVDKLKYIRSLGDSNNYFNSTSPSRASLATRNRPPRRRQIPAHWLRPEDGFDKPVITTIGLYQGTIRPQGSIHYEFNDNCEPAVFVAGLSSEDPGVSRTSQNLFVEDPELVKASLGYPKSLNNVNVTEFYGSIPAAFAQGG